MELEQLIKRVEWLEDEWKKEKSNLAALEEKTVVAEGRFSASEGQIKDITTEVVQLKAKLARIDQFDSELARHRLEVNRMIDEIEKHRTDRAREIEEFSRVQIEGVNGHIIELRKNLDGVSRLDGSIQARIEEDYRLNRLIDELQQKLQEFRAEEGDRVRSLRLIEEGQRRDTKRLTDLQGEVVAFRKRLDDQSGKQELIQDRMKKVDTRIEEIASTQADRVELQTEFMEKMSIKEVDRDRKWKEWETRFEAIEKEAGSLEAQILGLDEVKRSVKRAQETLEDMTERMERRINEITEMQRLSEDRFRQEWLTFKADDQKRWTNYTLNQEEQYREFTRSFEGVNEKLVEFKERIQLIEDLTRKLDEQIEKRLQGLMALARDWLAEYERALGRSR
jgi:chromosome segregation ATPase